MLRASRLSSRALGYHAEEGGNAVFVALKLGAAARCTAGTAHGEGGDERLLWRLSVHCLHARPFCVLIACCKLISHSHTLYPHNVMFRCPACNSPKSRSVAELHAAPLLPMQPHACNPHHHT